MSIKKLPNAVVNASSRPHYLNTILDLQVRQKASLTRRACPPIMRAPLALPAQETRPLRHCRVTSFKLLYREGSICAYDQHFQRRGLPTGRACPTPKELRDLIRVQQDEIDSLKLKVSTLLEMEKKARANSSSSTRGEASLRPKASTVTMPLIGILCLN